MKGFPFVGNYAIFVGQILQPLKDIQQEHVLAKSVIEKALKRDYYVHPDTQNNAESNISNANNVKAEVEALARAANINYQEFITIEDDVQLWAKLNFVQTTKTSVISAEKLLADAVTINHELETTALLDLLLGVFAHGEKHDAQAGPEDKKMFSRASEALSQFINGESASDNMESTALISGSLIALENWFDDDHGQDDGVTFVLPEELVTIEKKKLLEGIETLGNTWKEKSDSLPTGALSEYKRLMTIPEKEVQKMCTIVDVEDEEIKNRAVPQDKWSDEDKKIKPFLKYRKSISDALNVAQTFYITGPGDPGEIQEPTIEQVYLAANEHFAAVKTYNEYYYDAPPASTFAEADIVAFKESVDILRSLDDKIRRIFDVHKARLIWTTEVSLSWIDKATNEDEEGANEFAGKIKDVKMNAAEQYRTQYEDYVKWLNTGKSVGALPNQQRKDEILLLDAAYESADDFMRLEENRQTWLEYYDSFFAPPPIGIMPVSFVGNLREIERGLKLIWNQQQQQQPSDAYNNDFFETELSVTKVYNENKIKIQPLMKSEPLSAQRRGRKNEDVTVKDAHLSLNNYLKGVSHYETKHGVSAPYLWSIEKTTDKANQVKSTYFADESWKAITKLERKILKHGLKSQQRKWESEYAKWEEECQARRTQEHGEGSTDVGERLLTGAIEILRTYEATLREIASARENDASPFKGDAIETILREARAHRNLTLVNGEVV